MDYENQEMIESFFNARQTPHLIRHELEKQDEVHRKIKASGLDKEFAFDLLTQMVIYKRTVLSALVGLLKFHFNDKSDPWQSCADALKEACVWWLVDWDEERKQFVIQHDIGDKAHNLIRQYQYLPPMIVPPLTVYDNRGSGYIKIRDDSLILQDNHHEGDICLDSINRFNAIPMSINENMVKLLRNQWKNLDGPKTDEAWADYQKRKTAFERYERDSFFTLALLIEMGNEFWFTHKVDKRGRTYCQGYHVNTQGNSWNKNCLELRHKEYIQ